MQEIIQDIINKSDIEVLHIMENVDDRKIKIPDSCGVYILFNELRHMYIGSSQNVNKRIYTHLYINNLNRTRYLVGSIRYINVYITKDLDDARKLEKILINKLMPEFNIRKSRFKTTKTVVIKGDVHSYITKKRFELNREYGVQLSIFEITDYILRNYLEKLNIILVKVQKKDNPNESINDNGDANIEKSIAVADDVHLILLEKQLETEKNIGLRLTIPYIANFALKIYLDKIDEIINDIKTIRDK